MKYSEDDDIRQAEELHEYDRDDTPRCNHACCARLRAAMEVLHMQARHVPRDVQDWMLEGGGL